MARNLSFIRDHYVGAVVHMVTIIVASVVMAWIMYVMIGEIEDEQDSRVETLTYHNNSFIEVIESNDETILFSYVEPSTLEGEFLVNFQTTNEGFSLPIEQKQSLDDKDYRKAFCYTNQTNITITTALYNETSFDNLSGQYIVTFTKSRLTYLECLSSLDLIENPYQIYYNYSYKTIPFQAQLVCD